MILLSTLFEIIFHKHYRSIFISLSLMNCFGVEQKKKSWYLLSALHFTTYSSTSHFYCVDKIILNESHHSLPPNVSMWPPCLSWQSHVMPLLPSVTQHTSLNHRLGMTPTKISECLTFGLLWCRIWCACLASTCGCSPHILGFSSLLWNTYSVIHL